MPKTPAEIQLERDNQKKEIEKQLTLIDLKEARNKNLKAYREKQASIKERSADLRLREYDKHEQNYEKHVERFKEQAFSSTYTWMAAQMAIANLCYLHLLKQQALRREYTGKFFGWVKSGIKILGLRTGYGFQTYFVDSHRVKSGELGPVNLPPIKSELKIKTDSTTHKTTIAMEQTIGKESLRDFLQQAMISKVLGITMGQQDAVDFYDHTKKYFDDTLSLWLAKHGYKLDPNDQTVEIDKDFKPTAPQDNFSEKVFKQLNQKDPFNEYLKAEMPKMKVKAELAEDNSPSPKL